MKMIKAIKPASHPPKSEVIADPTTPVIAQIISFIAHTLLLVILTDDLEILLLGDPSFDNGISHPCLVP
jgi:hypothetical protein